MRVYLTAPVGVVLHPGHLILLDSDHSVLHGLVHDRVDGAHEEVQSGQEVLAIPSEVPLSLRIDKKLLTQLWRLVS